MNKTLAIECIKTQRQFVDDVTRQAFDMAIALLEQADNAIPKSCQECPYSHHGTWCVIQADWRKRNYCPDDEVSEDCPMGFQYEIGV